MFISSGASTPDLTTPHPNQTLSIHHLASHIMPTAVTRADKTSYYSSFGGKSSKRYKTTISKAAAPVPTEWEHKPNLIKPAPLLPPPSMKNGSHNVTCTRKPLLSEEEGVQDKKSVEDIPDNSARPLCDDILRQSFHSELLTPSMSHDKQGVLDYVLIGLKLQGKY
jgi:hypothetical protein